MVNVSISFCGECYDGEHHKISDFENGMPLEKCYASHGEKRYTFLINVAPFYDFILLFKLWVC